MVEREQVILPLRIDDIQNDAALKPPHHGSSEKRFLFLVTNLDLFHQEIGQLVMRELSGINAGDFEVYSKLIQNFTCKLRHVPLVWMLVARAISVDQFAREIFGDSERIILLVTSFERRAADRINRFPLPVHHIVIFEEMFARLEVL